MELVCKRQSHWLVLTYYRLRFDFSKSVQVSANNLINIHESSSLLILSAFYTVLIIRIRIIIIIIIIFSAVVHTAKSSHFHNKINSAPDMRNLFRTFNSLLCPPSPPPTTSITADDFATFFTDQTKTISSQFSPPLTQDLKPTRSTAQTPIFSFCPLTEAEVSKLLLSSHSTTCPLDPRTFSKLSLPHSYQHSHTSSTHLSSHASSPLHSSRLG